MQAARELQDVGCGKGWSCLEGEESCSGGEEHPFLWLTAWLQASTDNSCVGAGAAVGNWLRRTDTRCRRMLKALGSAERAALLWEQLCYFSISEIEDRAQGPIKCGGNTLQGPGVKMMTQESYRQTHRSPPVSSPLTPPLSSQGYQQHTSRLALQLYHYAR